MEGVLRQGEVINFNDWPARVEQDTADGPLVVQPLTPDELRELGPARVERLGLSPETKVTIAQRAGWLDLLESSSAA